MSHKTAVILFNLGGPDKLESVQPFLFNLFNDKAIIGLPQPFRYLLAKRISSKRNKEACEIYSHLGGKSPLLEQTQAQADALNASLGGDYKVFISMRYWHPMSDETAQQVAEYNPDEIVLLPLYPQFSTTTTGSSFADWDKAAKKHNINVPTKKIGCYFQNDDFIESHISQIKPVYDEAREKHDKVRILFSAHGLPQKIVDKGDPYQWQVEKTVEAIMGDMPDVDYTVCYQSRVGPLKWIEPYLDDELPRAAKDNVAVIIIPIAFTSEHSETLVELDIEYRHIADDLGIEGYYRVPTLSCKKRYIDCLHNIVKDAKLKSGGCLVCSNICPNKFKNAICNK